MYVVVRCPRCLLTIYTAFRADGKKGLVVKYLDGESRPFYNCPFELCGYHFNSNHDINLYSNTPAGHKRYVSCGFTIAPRTAETIPFRSKEQVAALAITLDTPQDVPQEPTVPGSQVGDKAQAAEDPGEGDGKGDVSVPVVTPVKNKTTRGMRWTVAEVEKLTRLAKEGLAHDEIAQQMERSTSSVKNKIAAMRDKGKLPFDAVQATPLKRKRDPEEDEDRLSAIP